jgi:hypothetical protein
MSIATFPTVETPWQNLDAFNRHALDGMEDARTPRCSRDLYGDWRSLTSGGKRATRPVDGS